MMDYLPFLLWPFLASLVLIGIHVYFGLHVIHRGIIFVDLSLAQVAAVGMTVAMLLGFELNDEISYLISLAFALFGAVVFTFTRNVEGRVPQEAIIGIVYAVCSALVIMLVSHSPEGTEHIKHVLVGSLLTVSPGAVIKTALAYAVIGLLHYLFRERFMRLSFDSENPPANKKLWDFLFYAGFAVVVTSSVKICGVLLVFIFLVAPSVFAAIVSRKISTRLVLGWLFGLLGAVLGMILSFSFDTPTGASIITAFGILLTIFAVGRWIFKTRPG